MFTLIPVRNVGGHIRESSAGSASSFVADLDLFPVESDRRYAFIFFFAPPLARASSRAAAETPWPAGSVMRTVGALTTRAE